MAWYGLQNYKRGFFNLNLNLKENQGKALFQTLRLLFIKSPIVLH
jgi:hypothetical protein